MADEAAHRLKYGVVPHLRSERENNVDRFRTNRWQFSVRTALVAMTVAAVCLAVGVRHPGIRTGALVVVGIAAAIVLFEKLVLSAATPVGARIWRVLTVLMWTTAGLIFLGSSCFAALLDGGLPDSYRIVTRLTTTTFVLAGVYCLYRAGREIRRPLPTYRTED